MTAHIQKRDTSEVGDVEITTQGILDAFKSGLEKTFSADNLNVSLNGVCTKGKLLDEALKVLSCFLFKKESKFYPNFPLIKKLTRNDLIHRR